MKRIGIGLVGTGWSGSVLLRALRDRDDVELAGVHTGDRNRGMAALTELGLSPLLLTENYEQLLARPQLEAVVLASPNGFHGQQALAAMKAGKHVFCEKPAATCFDEFVGQIQMQQRYPSLYTLVRYSLFFDPMSQWLEHAIRDGQFGTIAQLQVNYRHPVNIVGNRVWKLNRDIQGDAIGMAIIHAVYQCVRLLAPQTRPVAVFATCRKAIVRPFQAEPIWNLLIRFENGAAATIAGNIDFGNGYDLYHNLSGSAGAFIYDSLVERAEKVRYWSASTTDGNWVRPLDRVRCPEPLIWSTEMALPDSGDVLHHQTQQTIQHFVDAIRFKKASPLSFVNSAIIGEIGWAARISAATGREVMLPLDHRSAVEDSYSCFDPD
jgi:predicted dehydrogenase